MRYITIVMIIIVAFANIAYAQWKGKNSPTDENLNDVFAQSETSAWVCGDKGTILQFIDGDWIKHEGIPTLERLNAITAIDNNHVWACGDNGIVLFYNDSEWKLEDVPLVENPYSGKKEKMEDVVALDSNHVWTCGWHDANDPKGTSAYSGVILFWNGIEWEMQYQNTNNIMLCTMTACSENYVWCGGSGYSGAFCFYLFDGQKWIQVDESDGAWSGVVGSLYIDCSEDDTLWVMPLYPYSFSKQIFKFGYNGSSVKVIERWWDFGVALYDIYADIVVGQGSIFKYNSNKWVEQSIPPIAKSRNILACHGFGNQYWAVGEGGLILFDDGVEPTFTPTPTPTSTPTLTPTPIGSPPQIFLAGYWNTDISSATGGTLSVVAYVVDPDGDQITDVEVYYEGVPTGIKIPLYQTVSIKEGGFGYIFWWQNVLIEAGVESGRYLFELRATDGTGQQSSLWPYLTIE